MKICAIGDPHGDIEKIKKIPLDSSIDLILVTGDLGSSNLMRKMAFDNLERRKKGLEEIKYSNDEEKDAFMEAHLSSIEVMIYLRKFAPVKTIYGNVETSEEDTRNLSKEIGFNLPILKADLAKLEVQVINDELISVDGIKILGLEYFIDENWVEDFDPENETKLKIAKLQTKKAKNFLNKIGDVDILVCHQPPYEVLDKVNFKGAPIHWQNKNAGSKVILNYIVKNQPKYVFCGHIHEGYGEEKVGDSQVFNLGQGEYKIIEL